MKKTTMLFFASLAAIFMWTSAQAQQTYCTPEGVTATRFINHFATTGGSENITNYGTGFSTGGYANFTMVSVKQVQSNDVNFTAVVEGGTAGFRIWVDWNQDGEFDTTSEVAYQSSSSTGTHTGSFTVPATALEGTTRMRIVSHWQSSTGDVSPCETGFTFGEFEDYTFEVVALQDCTEAIAGTVVGPTDMEVCANTPFSMSIEGNSEAASGLIRTWQSSPAGQNDWTDLDITLNTLNIAGITASTDYRYHAECNNGDSDNSEVIAVAINANPAQCYCTPEGVTATRYINNFSTTGGSVNISNISSGFSDGGYGDFTTMTAKQVQDNEVEFEVNIEGGTAGFRIWVDWNQDGQFDTTTEVAYHSTGYLSSHTGSFTVPDTAIAGETRMRIVSHWLSQPGLIDPCETGFTYGEFEDYTFNVVALENCTEANAGTAIGATEMEMCGNAGFSLSVEGNSEAATGLIRTWQSSPAGENDWTDLNISSATLNIPGVSTATDFRYHVECENGDSDNSAVFSITINPIPEECYCIPEGTNSSRHISDFSTTGGSENITNSGSGFSTGGYGDFTAMIVEANAGDSVDFSATVVGGSAGFRIWVDWNKDGFFDTTEEVAYNSSSYETSHTGTINVPGDAIAGETRMRIASHWLSAPGLIDPCETGFTYGEFEDYTFNVTAPSCWTPSGIASSNIGIESADISWIENGSATEWEVIWGPNGFDPETEGTTVTVNDDPELSLSDLTQNTIYDIYVTAICGADESNTAGPYSFTTSCDTATVPYLLDFNAAVLPNIPNCTTIENTGIGNDWTTKTAPAGMTGKALNYSYHLSTNPGQANSWFYTQGIQLEAGVDYEISYKYGNNSTYFTESMKVAFGTSANEASMTNELADYPTIQTSAIITETIAFTADTDGIYYFGFNAYSIENQNQLYLDDISITVGTMSVDDHNKLSDTRLFPNPLNSDTFYVHAPKLNGERVEVNISDMAGRLVFKNTLDCNNNKVTVSVNDTLTSGVYLVTLKHAGETQTYRLIKE